MYNDFEKFGMKGRRKQANKRIQHLKMLKVAF
jgi:hypothetical protein